MSNQRFKARDLLQYPAEQLQDFPEWFDLEFDDGTVEEVTREHTFYSRYFWEFHKAFPKIPLLKNHHLELVLGDKDYSSDSHTTLCENIQATILEHYDYWNQPINRQIAKLTKWLTNDMTNGMTKYGSRFSSTITNEEIVYTMRHPRIVEVLLKMRIGEATPEEAYAVGHDVLMNDPVVSRTGLGIAYRGGSIKRNQCLQVIVSVGIRTEADGAIFNWSIDRGYGEGITDIAEFAADSRGAPKALKSAEGPIQESDYLSRRLKLVANVVKSVEPTDCETTKTFHWFILPEVKDENGAIVQKSGLNGLVGRYYYDEEGELKRISGKEKELEGTYIHLRDINRCELKNGHNVCRICFGDLWYNLQEVTNVGYACVAAFMELIIQLTLSTKHVVGSAVGEGIRLAGQSLRYFKVGKKKNQYYLTPLLKRMKLRIIIPRTSINGLDKLKVSDLEDLAAAHISRINRIMLRFTENNVEQTDVIDLNQGNRAVFMTQEFLEFALQKKCWVINEEVNYEFDLEGWDFTEGIFALPEMEMSFAERGAEIGKMIESNMEMISERYKPDSPLKTLSELYELVSRSLDIPLSCLSVLIYANSIAGPNDYRLARHSSAPVLGVARLVTQYRSLSNALAFETLEKIILDPRSFFPNGRPDSDFDVFFDPHAVVKRHNAATKA